MKSSIHSLKLLFVLVLVLDGCVSSSDRGFEPVCVLDIGGIQNQIAPPRNSNYLRDIAEDAYTVEVRSTYQGSTVSRQKWIARYVSWYRSYNGDLIAYVSDNDNLVHVFRFSEVSGWWRLIAHGTLDCNA